MSPGPSEGSVKGHYVFRNKVNAYIGKSFKITRALQNGVCVLLVGHMNVMSQLQFKAEL